MVEAVHGLAETIAAARRIVAFTGAGISTESGIPDFRSPSGIWSRLDPNDFTISNYLHNPEHRRRIWQMRVEHAGRRFSPNAAHRALVELERLGILDCVVTQNIDGLHQDAGSTVVLELHGSNRLVRCLDCRDEMPAGEALDRVRAGEDDPHCRECGGLLKSTTVSFGEAMPFDVLSEAYERAGRCDLCLVVGSSLVVYPAADVPIAAHRGGARLAIVNAEPTGLDGLADVVVAGRAGEVLPSAVRAALDLLAAG